MNKIENPMKVKPIFPLLISMSVPTMISMLIQSMYNIVDSIFVSQISENALTAVSLVFRTSENSFSCSYWFWSWNKFMHG